MAVTAVFYDTTGDRHPATKVTIRYEPRDDGSLGLRFVALLDFALTEWRTMVGIIWVNDGTEFRRDNIDSTLYQGDHLGVTMSTIVP